MKFTIDRLKLYDILLNVSSAAASKSTMTALEGILVLAKNDTVTFTGYNLELGIVATADADVIKEGSVVLQSKLFFDSVRRMSGEDISVDCDINLNTVISSGKTEITISGMDSGEFPELPEVTGQPAGVISQSVLKSMISQTIFAVSQNDNRPIQTGVLFELQDGIINTVAVDGYRLALRREQAVTNMEANFVIPGKTLSEINKMLKDDEQEVTLSPAKNHILIEFGGFTVISRLLEGDFLDYKSAIPKDGNTFVRVNTRALMDSIDRASVVIDDRLLSPVKMKIDSDIIKVMCNSSLGKVYDEIPAEVKGEEVEIGFNHKYMNDALKAAGTDRVECMLSGGLSPVVIRPTEGNNFEFLVLPVRIKGE